MSLESRGMSKVSESFKARADGAAFWEAWVASVLTRGGLYVQCHPWTIDGKDHSQDFDLTVGSHQDCGLEGGCYLTDAQYVEVKSLSLNFTGPEDYPKDEVLVCSQNSYIRKASGRGLYAPFILCSTATGSLVYIPKGTEVTFGKEVHDRTRNELYKAVTVPKSALRPVQDFIELFHG